MQQLHTDAESNGALTSYNTHFLSGKTNGEKIISKVVNEGKRYEICSSHLINCAGLCAGGIARSVAGFSDSFYEEIPATYFAKGSYFRYVGHGLPFRRLVYPLPEPGLIFFFFFFSFFSFFFLFFFSFFFLLLKKTKKKTKTSQILKKKKKEDWESMQQLTYNQVSNLDQMLNGSLFQMLIEIVQIFILKMNCFLFKKKIEMFFGVLFESISILCNLVCCCCCCCFFLLFSFFFVFFFVFFLFFLIYFYLFIYVLLFLFSLFSFLFSLFSPFFKTKQNKKTFRMAPR